MRITVTILLALIFTTSANSADEKATKPTGWLIGAESDSKRFELLQRYLRGFDQPMWEIGERYKSMHEALERDNVELASYQWDKIKVTIENGYLKRPARQQNAEKIFLNANWYEVKEAFESKDINKARNGFSQARAACMACHAAESVPYMNNQPLFDLKLSDISNVKEK
jgi:cytochrome c553